jgi:hypothetical protein
VVIYNPPFPCTEIDDPERKLETIDYLLAMIPLQNYNLVAYFTHFLKECVSRSAVNGLTVESVARIFGQAYLRTHGIISIDETERQQSSAVAAYMISECDKLFKGPLDVNDKEAEASRRKRRKKAKEMLSNFEKSESKKLRKEHKQKKRGTLRRDDEVSVGYICSHS